MNVSDIAQVVQGKRILITGAGGSIGAELSVLISKGQPESLLLLSHSEQPLYNVERRIEGECRTVLADVRSYSRIKGVIRDFSPDVVIHAAAIKHVPMAERHPCEAVLTNVMGSINVAEAAFSCGVERLIFISTDKAVNPACVMGATKRLAELYLMAVPINTTIVRFGNVIGTSGSVIPLFERQIAAGGPVTVTHKDMTRYFMSVEEATRLVVETMFMAYADHLYILDMGAPRSIVDLAQSMIGERNIEIEFTGLRPGEKLAEELVYFQEACAPSPRPGVLEGSPAKITRQQRRTLPHLEQAAKRGEDSQAVALLKEILEEYA